MSSAIPFPSSIPWFAWIPIVAIVCSSVNILVASMQKHRERMAMIQQGMNPDAPAAKPGPLPEY